MTRICFTVILLTFFCATTLAYPFEDSYDSPVATADAENYRLPDTIRPQNYKIKLRPYLLDTDGANQFTFDGEVQIEIVSSVATSEIVLHAKNLVFKKSEFWPKSSRDNVIQLPQPVVNSVTDKLTFTLITPLRPSEVYVLHFVYTGILSDEKVGFFRSSYVDANKKIKWVGSTQFQVHHARRAIPSFDEPKFKATFDVSITRHKSMNSVANTAIISTVPNGDYVTETFEQTPKMSVYLLAFVVSEFTERKNTDSSFSVLARPEYYSQSEYGFTIGQKILSELENYFGIKYYEMGIPKMHMAAIPERGGAMENWGLITYAEEFLLYLEGSTTLVSKRGIASVIAHEQTHMWFGDLVTCDWWSYTWLNEGFATFFQYYGTEMAEKDMGHDQLFVPINLHAVMRMDSTNSANPLSDENTNSPSDLSRMFNMITYSKGASFIRMIMHTMGERNFRSALQDYLKEYKYQNTIPDNLFKHWKAKWPKDTLSYADGVFSNFTLQVGYPLISVKISDGNKAFTVTQKRFLLNDKDGSNTSLRYTVPITYTTDKSKNFASTTPAFYYEASKTEHNVPVDNGFDWVILNIQETGYYRVNYDENNWRAIHRALTANDNWSGIHELNRAQIVDDLLNLARAGEISYNLALEVLEYLKTETNYLSWADAFNGFSYLAIRLGEDKEHFSQYILDLTEKSYKHLGFIERSTDSALDIYNRPDILAWSCKYGNEECVEKVMEYFNNMATTAVPVNIRSVIYCNAMRFGNETHYDKLFNKYKTETIATEKTIIANNLGCVKDSKLVEKFFNVILSDETPRQDKGALITLYRENIENIDLVFDLVTKNFEELSTVMGGYPTVAAMIADIASYFTEESQQKKLKEFNAQNKEKLGSSAATLEAAEKTVEENFRWSSTHLGTIKSYLMRRRDDGASSNGITVITLLVCSVLARILY